jgi:hypothetical protein
MARAEGEPQSFKEKAKKYGVLAAIAGGAILVVSASWGMVLLVGGGGTCAGAKYLESRSGKH